MTDYMEAASAVLAAAQRQVEISAQNVSNMATPGYRRLTSFEQALSQAGAAGGAPLQVTGTDFSQGKPLNTDSPLDLSLSGAGFFTVRDGDRLLYTRDGQFRRDQDSRIVTQSGLPVQLQGGGDLVAKSGQFKVLPDGTVTENDEPLGKLALAEIVHTDRAERTAGGLFSTAGDNVAEAKAATVNQGSLEASNTSLSDEMVAIMHSLRSAEAGQRLVNVYDDLLGRAISSFGQQS